MMKKFKRRSFGNSSQFVPKFDIQNAEEAPPLDLSRDAADNMRYLLTEITRKEHMTTSKKMGFLNNFSQFVRSVPSTSNFGFTLDQITACLRLSLISPAMEVRAAGFRAFRHLLVDKESLNTFLQQRLDVFIMKSLDNLAKRNDAERIQALRLIRKMVYLCADSFPISLAMSLSAICCDMSTEKDHMSRPCLATLCELAVLNIPVAAYSGVVHAVILNTLDCTIPRMNEALISTVLYLLNHPHYRCFVRKRVGLEAVLAPFTDFYYRYNSDIPDNLLKEDQINRITSASLALVAIIKSWAGLIYLCNPEWNSFETLLGVFRLPNNEIRKAVIDMLFEIFCLPQPTWTNHFSVALLSVDPSKAQDSWSLSEEFVIAEAEAILPHLAHLKRVNLIESYLSLMLCAFFDAGILESLVCVVTTSDDYICIRGCILLGELLHMANMLMPPSYSSHTNCLPSLMTALAANNEKTPEERGKASAAVGYLHQLHQMKKQKPVCNSLFMREIIAQSKSNAKIKGLEYQISSRDTDDVLTAIRDTLVTTLPEEDFEQWNWDLISTLLDSSKVTIKRPDEPLYLRFVKKLLTFYKPDKKLYSFIKQSSPETHKYTDVALQLTDFLMQPAEQPEGEKLLLDLIHDIAEALGEAVHPGIVNGIFSKTSLTETLSCGYLLIIGRLTSTTNGWVLLNKTLRLVPLLCDICSMHSREYLIKLIISSLNYQGIVSRILLSKVLINRSTASRLHATKFLRVLLLAGVPYFSNWGVEILSFQLYDYDPEVVEAAISVLEEACEDAANLKRLIEVKPCLMHLGGQGIRLLSRFVSEIIGFEYLKEKDYLEPLLRIWTTEYNREYVNWIEIEIAKSLSTFEPQSQDGVYVRRSNSCFKKRRDVYILPHLYGELAVNEFGVELIIKQNFLEDAVNVVVKAVTDTVSDIIQLKAALWSIGHISSRWMGIDLILKYKYSASTLSYESDETNASEAEKNDQIDIVALIINMAQNSPVLTIRGTCFFVLGLMASTQRGADKLEEFGWSCVRHEGTDMWPVIEPDYTYILEPESSDEDPENEVNDEEEVDSKGVQQIDPSIDMSSGIYMGNDVPDNEDNAPSFDYSVEKYGEEKKKKKKVVDESRTFQTNSLMGREKPDLCNQSGNIRVYDVNEKGQLYEIVLENNVDRLCSLPISTNSEIPMFPDKESRLSAVSSKISDKSIQTKETFDIHGIYLGEEEIVSLDDSIEANLSFNIQSYPNENSRTSESGEPLLPIKEEKSQESLSQEKFSITGISVEDALTIELKLKEEYTYKESLPDTNSTINSEDRTPTQSPHIVQIQNEEDTGRYRSISLNERSTMSYVPASLRSSSFSDGNIGHFKYLHKNNRYRADSDPGVVANTYLNDLVHTRNVSILQGAMNEKKKSYIAKVNRDKSQSITEDDRDRSSSILSDSSANAMQLKMSNRLRDGSVVSLGPKATRGLSSTFSESPISLTYSRDLGNFAYTAWRTLKKQRSFKREIDFAFRRDNNFPDKGRYSSRSLALRYRRNLDSTKNRRSVGQLMPFTRRQISSYSTSSSDYYPNDAERSQQRYVGRCLPMNISDFFKLERYEYVGSWAEHFYEFSAQHNIQTFDQHYQHVKERCLACSLDGKFSQSFLDVSIQNMTASPNKDDSDDEQLKSSSKVRNDILRQVVNLSSAVSSKVAQQELISLRSKYPWAFQNLCLYSQVMEQLGMFTYRLSIRRFIHALFEGVDFGLVIETADHILGRLHESTS